MPTPANFDGIFYSPDTGSDYIFDEEVGFITMIKDQDDGLFLALGAYVDLLVNGHNELATKFFECARTTWPEIDWDRIDSAISTIKQLAFETKPNGWRHQVYELITQTALPIRYFAPADYQCIFFQPDFIETIFTFRGRIVRILNESSGCDIKMLALILADLDLNRQTELIWEIETSIKEVHPDIDWERLSIFRQQAQLTYKTGHFDPNFLLNHSLN